MPLFDRLETAKEDLHRLADQTSRHEAELAARTKDEEERFHANAAHLSEGADGLRAALRGLEGRVRDVARSTGRIGDKLCLADRQRAAATEARVLATHLSAFNSCRLDVDDILAGTATDADGERGSGGGGGVEGIPRVFRDSSRSVEAVRLAQRLLRLAHDAADLERAERVAAARAEEGRPRNGSGSGSGSEVFVAAATARPASLAMAIENLERYCDSLENRLLEAFSDAESAGDVRGMKAAARSLGHFNKGASLAQRFIATRPMFMSVESLQEIETLQEAAASHDGTGGAGGQMLREADAVSASKASLEALVEFYAKVREAVTAEVATASEIFPRPSVVLAPLVHRVIEQRVGAALDAVLPPPPPPPGTAAAVHQTPAGVGLLSPSSRPSRANRPNAVNDGFLSPRRPPRARGHARFTSFGGLGDATSFASVMPSSASFSDISHLDLAVEDPTATAPTVRPPGPGHFALLAHLHIICGAVRLTRELGVALTEVIGEAGDVAAAADGLFTGRRERYAELEVACLRGMAAGAAAAGANPDVAGGKVPGLDRVMRWHREAAERCAIVLGPPPARALPATRVRAVGGPSAEDDEDDGAFENSENEKTGQKVTSYLRGLGIGKPTEEEILDAGLIPPGWSTRNRNGVGGGGGGECGEFASTTVASVASAAALATVAAAEQHVMHAALHEARRLMSDALEAAVDMCERQSGRLTAQSSAADVAAGGVGVVLRAVGAVNSGVASIRVHVAEQRDTAKRRARTADHTRGSAAAAVTAAVTSAAEASDVALADLETALAVKVTAALHRGLDSLFYVVERVLRALQKRAEFNPNEDETEKWTSFPGQEPSAACAAVLSLVKRAHATAVECLTAATAAGDDDAASSSEDPNVQMVANDMARRLHAVVTEHVARFSYSMIGALQLKRDLGEYEGWVRKMANSERQLSTWRTTLELCSALIIPAAGLPSLLADTRRVAEEAAAATTQAGWQETSPSAAETLVSDMVRMVQLRSDYHPAILSRPNQARSASVGEQRAHRRAGSFMGSYAL